MNFTNVAFPMSGFELITEGVIMCYLQQGSSIILFFSYDTADLYYIAWSHDDK